MILDNKIKTAKPHSFDGAKLLLFMDMAKFSPMKSVVCNLLIINKLQKYNYEKCQIAYARPE